MNEVDDFDNLINDLVAEGCLRRVDEEYLQLIDDKMQNLHPELYERFVEAQRDEVEEALLGLVNKGLMEFQGVDDDGEITYTLTPKGIAYVESQA